MAPAAIMIDAQTATNVRAVTIADGASYSLAPDPVKKSRTPGREREDRRCGERGQHHQDQLRVVDIADEDGHAETAEQYIRQSARD